MSLIDYIIQFDQWVVLTVSQHHTPFLDRLMWDISTFYCWLPLFITVALLVLHTYRIRFFRILLVFICVIWSVNIVGDMILKPLIGRIRPTHCDDLVQYMNLVIKPNGHPYRGGMYSHPSGHAGTSFSFIVISLYYLRPVLKHYRSFLVLGILYVLVVSFSRIYLGVHYPTDILNGYLLAGLITSSWILLMRKWDAPLLSPFRMEDLAKSYY